MSREEIALQITLKAIENRDIVCKHREDGNDANAFNADQIANFYNAIYSKISTDKTDG